MANSSSFFLGHGTPAAVASLLTTQGPTAPDPATARFMTLGFRTAFEGQWRVNQALLANDSLSFILFPEDPKLLKPYGLPRADGYEVVELAEHLGDSFRQVERIKAQPLWRDALVLRPAEFYTRHPKTGAKVRDLVEDWTMPRKGPNSTWNPTSTLRVADLDGCPRGLLKRLALAESPANDRLRVPDFDDVEPVFDWEDGRPGPRDGDFRTGLRLPEGLELLALDGRERLVLEVEGWPLRHVPRDYLLWFARDRTYGKFTLHFSTWPEWLPAGQFLAEHALDPFTFVSADIVNALHRDDLFALRRVKRFALGARTRTKGGKPAKEYLVVRPGGVPVYYASDRHFLYPGQWVLEFDLKLREGKDNVLLDTVKRYVNRAEFAAHERARALYHADSVWGEFFGSGYWSGRNCFDPESGQWVEEFVSTGTAGRPGRGRNPELRANSLDRRDDDPAPGDWVLGLSGELNVPSWNPGTAGVATANELAPWKPFRPAWSEEVAWKRLLHHQAWLEREASFWSDQAHRCRLLGLDRSEFLADLDERADHLALIEAELGVHPPTAAVKPGFEVLASGKVKLEVEKRPRVVLPADRAEELFGSWAPVVADDAASRATPGRVACAKRGDLVLFWVRNLAERARAAQEAFRADLAGELDPLPLEARGEVLVSIANEGDYDDAFWADDEEAREEPAFEDEDEFEVEEEETEPAFDEVDEEVYA